MTLQDQKSRDFLSLGDLIDNLITPSFSDEKNKPSNLANYQNNVRQIRNDFEKAIRGQYPAKINEIATALDQAFANDDKKEAFRLLLRLGKIHYLENIIGSVTDNEKWELNDAEYLLQTSCNRILAAHSEKIALLLNEFPPVPEPNLGHSGWYFSNWTIAIPWSIVATWWESDDSSDLWDTPKWWDAAIQVDQFVWDDHLTIGGLRNLLEEAQTRFLASTIS